MLTVVSYRIHVRIYVDTVACNDDPSGVPYTGVPYPRQRFVEAHSAKLLHGVSTACVLALFHR